MPGRARWERLWQALGLRASEQERSQHYADLLARYAEPTRHYHTAQHLDECLAHLDDMRGAAARVAECEFALWYHDAVYAALASDNERRSADLAAQVLASAGAAPDRIARVEAMILATTHAAAPAAGDIALVVDIDLAILGASEARFDKYEHQVRAEYAWVPGPIFRAKRRAVLEAFLARPALYSTSVMRERFESAARANLRRSIVALGG